MVAAADLGGKDAVLRLVGHVDPTVHKHDMATALAVKL